MVERSLIEETLVVKGIRIRRDVKRDSSFLVVPVLIGCTTLDSGGTCVKFKKHGAWNAISACRNGGWRLRLII